MTTSPIHETFLTTSERGLRHDILPMRLYHKAKRLGVWDPRSIDFSQDIQDWQHFNDDERRAIISLTALFQAGE
ncbi:MAG TPA: ribonucleotide-diphosphate reductase, partial [Ktedonobacteraceae bacterium]|nr:ribonucleotide-diphosphate reductase [Ktedonobacteraceae bacterium]